MRIAYVEDNVTNLALIERVARMSQHTVVPYTEGEIALEELAREKFDLILMDVELAGEISGLEVVRKLRQRGLHTPIVAVTAYAMMGDRQKCIDAGCNDYLPKPLPINDVVAVLARYAAQLKEKEQEVAGLSAARAEPAPTEAAPAEAAHSEPVPEPVPTEPAPAEAVHVEPVRTEPAHKGSEGSEIPLAPAPVPAPAPTPVPAPALADANMDEIRRAQASILLAAMNALGADPGREPPAEPPSKTRE